MSSSQEFKIIEKIGSFIKLWDPLAIFIQLLVSFFSISLLKTPHERKTLDKKRKLLTIFFVGVFDQNQKTLYKCKKLLTNAKNFIQENKVVLYKLFELPCS